MKGGVILAHQSPGTLPLTGSVPLPPDEAAAITTVFARVGDRYVPLTDFVREVQTLMDRDAADEVVGDYRADREFEAQLAQERDAEAYDRLAESDRAYVEEGGQVL